MRNSRDREKSKFAAVFVLLVFALSPGGVGGVAAATTPRTILVFGDSLSSGYGLAPGEGWVALLRDRLAARGGWRVVNASVSGDTTRGGVARLPEALARNQPAIVVIELGANDGLRGLKLAEMRRNLGRLIETARGAGARILLLGVRLPPNYGPRYSELFQRSYRDTAARYGVAQVPFLLAGVGGNRALMQADGLHPTAAAQSRLLDNVWKKLAPML